MQKARKLTVLGPQIVVNINNLNLQMFIDFFHLCLDILSGSKNRENYWTSRRCSLFMIFISWYYLGVDGWGEKLISKLSVDSDCTFVFQTSALSCRQVTLIGLLLFGTCVLHPFWTSYKNHNRKQYTKGGQPFCNRVPILAVYNSFRVPPHNVTASMIGFENYYTSMESFGIFLYHVYT